MTALTRGPLPARVYWTRRVLLLVVVSALVVGLVQLVSLALGGGTPREPGQVAPAAAEATATEAPQTEPPADEPTRQAGKKRKDRGERKDREPELALPEGPCADRDIAVTPTAEETVGGAPITFVLELRTIASTACTWEVSPQSLSVKITSGDDGIWYSQQCPRSIPKEDVVLRDNVTTEVEVTWSSRRSDDGCTKFTDWALPGWYHVEAAALAGEPSDLQFRLTAPEPEVRTETVEPKPDKKGQKKGEQNGDQKNRDGDRSG